VSYLKESIKITTDDDEPVNQKIVIDQLVKSEKDNQSDEVQSIERQDNRSNLALEQEQRVLYCLENGGFLRIYHWTISLVRYIRE